MRQWINRVPRLLLPVMLALLAGCASLPDMSPYRDATVQLRSTMLAGGSAVQSGLEAAAASYETDDQTAQRVRKQAQQFADAWRARIEAADALVTYADAVADITRSGGEGAATARSLADALSGLAVGAGIALPPSGTVSTVTDLAAFVYGHIAAVRASQSLEQALQSAQPAVDRVAALLSQDLQSSQVILRSAHELQRTALTLKYNNELGYLKALVNERKDLYAKGSLSPEEEQRLQRIGQLFDTTRTWREPLEAAQAETERNLRLRLELIEATRMAVAEWAAAHRSIAAAVKEKRRIDVAALVQATLEARELVRRLRAL